MTIFSFPRVFADIPNGLFKTNQINAITSWKLTQPKAEIILFGNESGTEAICKELNLKHFKDAKVNNFGTPYLNHLFETAQEIASSEILCYLHSDVILLEDLTDMIKTIKITFNQFLLLARRYDLFSEWNGTVKESKEMSIGKVNFSGEWKNSLKELIYKHGRLRHPGSCDCYIFTKNLYPKGYLPDFLLGRQLWDGWIIYDAIERVIPSVDISSFRMLHQTHTRHKWGLLNPKQFAQEFENNRQLAGGKKKRVDQIPYFWKDNKLQLRS